MSNSWELEQEGYSETDVTAARFGALDINSLGYTIVITYCETNCLHHVKADTCANCNVERFECFILIPICYKFATLAL